ncbi:hypothetical protein [Microbacterium sulfonylureivorans]|uniref:hypothetical protein n=1 Tax=Microbacterium sulfonylureivorans TaxID=2486854 RepID=UPI000FDB057F|nr:hypothetical protein [Microbacterium sulfonylureivorans]
MLVIDKILRRARGKGDEGAVLITVVIVMLVGFIVASVVAASVLFTIQANAQNRSETQAFVAAESGRDVAVASIAAGCSAITFTGTDPIYLSAVYSTAGNQPASATAPGVAAGCPTSTTRYVVIRSTGTGADGSTATIDAVYPWQVAYSQQPGGVVTYFSGGFTAGVSHYTGDLVLRDGNWSCNVDGILDGDLYVLQGDTNFANNCQVNGDIWSNGNVTSNSQAIKVRGDITTNGYVDISSNGGALIDGFVTAKGNLTLSDQGSTQASVTGNLTSRNSISVGSKWTAPGTRTPNSPTDPVFEPTLEWLRAATKWIDLDNTGWGTVYSATNVCNLIRNNPNPTIKQLVETPGSRLVLDFTGCGNGAVDITLGNVTPVRDVVMIAKPSVRLLVDVNGTVGDDGNNRQILFIHSDATRNYTGGEPVPNCGNGNQNDKFDVSGAVDANVRIMMYTPCGITGTATSSFSGQYYTNDSTHMHASATYTCKSMSWSPAFDQLGCKIKGAGGVAEGSLVQRLGGLVYQTEL